LAIATVPDLKKAGGSRLQELPESQLQFWLDDAELAIVDLGVDRKHPRFKTLQVVLTLDYLESTNTLPNEISSESVDDVNISYDTNIAIGSAVFWSARFKEMLTQILGFKNRIVV
jgi:hypothetical protein